MPPTLRQVLGRIRTAYVGPSPLPTKSEAEAQLTKATPSPDSEHAKEEIEEPVSEGNKD